MYYKVYHNAGKNQEIRQVKVHEKTGQFFVGNPKRISSTGKGP